MTSYTSRDIQKRLHNSANIVVQRSLLAEGRLLALVVLSYVSVHLISYSVPDLKWGIGLGTLFGQSVGILFSPLEFIPIALFLWMARCVLDERYVIQPRSLLRIKGFTSLGLSSTELYYDTVRTIQIEQTLYQQLVNIGDVRIGSLFAENSDVVMRGVRNPYQYKAFIEQRRAAKQAKPAPRLRARRERLRSAAAKRAALHQFR